MGRFLLARVGKPRTMTAGKQTASLVQLSDLAAAISAVRIYRTGKPWPLATKATWRPYDRELLLHTGPVRTVPATSVFQGYAMSFQDPCSVDGSGLQKVLISMYNATSLSPGPILLPHLMRAILTKRLTFR